MRSARPSPPATTTASLEQWVGAPNGRVIKVVSGGIDTTGDGTADDTGIGAAERDKVLALYAPGTELWRVEVTHFTPWDYNYPYGPPDGTTEPPPTIGPRDPKLLGGPDASIGPGQPPDSNPCPEKGSIIRCDDQVLGERLAIAGTPLQLVYASDRVPGRQTQRTIEIVLRDGTLPESLAAVDLEIEVAGRSFSESFTPAEVDAEPVYEFTWDGLDAYGRRVYGAQVAEIGIGYRYPAVYRAPAEFASSWAQVSGLPITGNRARQDFTLWKRDTAAISYPDVRGAGFGGWTISDHHQYDPTTHTLRLGNGRISGATANRLAALEQIDASPALDGPTALATAPDGATWIADTRNQLVRRVAGDGTVTTVAGTGDYGYRPGDDGGPATSARLSSPQALSVVDGGEGATVAYVADTNANRIRRIAADGTIATVAGGGSSLGDDGPASAARLSVPQGVVAAPDGALYVADTGQHRIRMIGTDGQITTIAGDGTPGFEGDGGAAVDARLREPTALALDADGRLLVADTGNGRVRMIGLDGRSRR